MNGMAIGFALILFAAVCGGGFAVPIKLKRRYELENLYVVAASTTMIVLPLLVAAFVLPHWPEAIAGVGPMTIWRGLGFGFAWGLGVVAFGYGISMVGLSLGYAVIMGINTAVGSMLPFLAESRESLLQPSGTFILVGVAGCILGVVVCSIAGRMRDRKTESRAIDNDASSGNPGSLSAARPQWRKFSLGLILCIASGVMSACANLGFAFTSQVGASAVRMGASPVIAGLGSWMLVYWGGFAATFLWFGGQQLRKGTWRKNFGNGSLHDFRLAVVMGVLWFLAMVPYGMGAYYLGRLGTSAGWGISIAASLVVANLLGFFTGEWKSAPAPARKLLFAGLAVLIAAMACLAKGNSLALSERPKLETNTAALADPGGCLPPYSWRSR
jgi:L-rhamnose-H+ transport protein